MDASVLGEISPKFLALKRNFLAWKFVLQIFGKTPCLNTDTFHYLKNKIHIWKISSFHVRLCFVSVKLSPNLAHPFLSLLKISLRYCIPYIPGLFIFIVSSDLSNKWYYFPRALICTDDPKLNAVHYSRLLLIRTHYTAHLLCSCSRIIHVFSSHIEVARFELINHAIFSKPISKSC